VPGGDAQILGIDERKARTHCLGRQTVGSKFATGGWARVCTEAGAKRDSDCRCRRRALGRPP
jgi:hypothetical protein